MLPGSENHVKFDLSLEPLSKDSYFAKATNQTHSQTGFSLILTRSQGCNSIDIFPSEPVPSHVWNFETFLQAYPSRCELGCVYFFLLTVSTQY